MIAISILLAASLAVGQSAATVFKGRPSMKVSEGGVERTPEAIDTSRAVNLECVISRIGDSFYWASRENTELRRVDGGGAFVTFIATNGAGYIRVIKPEAKKAAALLSQTEERYDYVEHVMIGLRTITYFGTAR